MNEQPENVSEDQIHELLQQIQHLAEEPRDFAFILLSEFRDSCVRILAWQKETGRPLAMLGEDTEHVRQETYRKIQGARNVLHGKLQSLLAWARGEKPVS